MKKQIVLLAVAALFFASSCEVIKTKTTKTADIYGAGVIQKPVVADLVVQQTKVTGVSAGKPGAPYEVVKQEAIANAISKSNADVLVEPQFETETSGSITTVTVKGWPANYKNFRPIKEEDVALLNIGADKQVYTPAPVASEAPRPKKKKGGAVAAVFGTVLGSGAILTTLLLILN